MLSRGTCRVDNLETLIVGEVVYFSSVPLTHCNPKTSMEHFSGWKLIYHLDSHSSRAVWSSCSFMASSSLRMGLYSNVSSTSTLPNSRHWPWTRCCLSLRNWLIQSTCYSFFVNSDDHSYIPSYALQLITPIMFCSLEKTKSNVEGWGYLLWILLVRVRIALEKFPSHILGMLLHCDSRPPTPFTQSAMSVNSYKVSHNERLWIV